VGGLLFPLFKKIIIILKLGLKRLGDIVFIGALTVKLGPRVLYYGIIFPNGDSI